MCAFLTSFSFASRLRGGAVIFFSPAQYHHLDVFHKQYCASYSVATFPKAGTGPVNDPSIQARLKGLKWLADGGKSLPAGVERVLVMDATDLKDLPLTNDDPNLPHGVDVEGFWRSEGRKPSRVLLRHGDNAVAIAVAKAAAKVSIIVCF